MAIATLKACYPSHPLYHFLAHCNFGVTLLKMSPIIMLNISLKFSLRQYDS